MIPRRALARRAAGGKRAVGRDSLSVIAYRILRATVYQRADYRCECCRKFVSLELEHAVPRSRGGADTPDNCWAVGAFCGCHRWKDMPFANGRLVVVPLGHGKFRWEEWKGPDKWTATLIRVIRDGRL